MKSFKIIYLFLFFGAGLSACDGLLDVQPVDAVTADQAITDAAGLQSAMLGVYDAFQSNSLYGRDLYIVGALASGDAERTGTSLDYQQISNRNILADNAVTEGIWAQSYTAINQANVVIAKANSLGNLTEEQREQFLLQAYGLRALAHLNLVQLFGAIPYRDQPVQGLEGLDIARTPEAEVYENILADLEMVAEFSATVEGRSFMNLSGIIALDARTSLYYATFLAQNGQSAGALYQRAFDKAATLESSAAFDLMGAYSTVFESPENDEILFALNYSIQDRNRMGYYLSPTSVGGRGEVAYTKSLFNAYSSGDARKDFIFRDIPTLDGQQVTSGVAKYSDVSGGADPVVVFRLSEMYYIMAEALWALEGMSAESQILALLNTVEERSGMEVRNLGSRPVKTILELKRKELCFEGHRWVDICRTESFDLISGMLPNERYFPIPLAEIQTNELISEADQNPGY
ncbi:RagB/SusD family nutrient uptake outer membrane protein [Persicobacter diffluens]|uniref:Membrane protein n=1 Tax=Persicobacter diffluens TaxID=981 RepID=A0AAN4VY72_9BACT|nr:membrane protein [Persicobacter diffluens]